MSAWIRWLEARLAVPSFPGWMLLLLALAFFLAGTNTLSGWLFVMAGLLLALMGVSVFSARRQLQFLTVRHPALAPVSVGSEGILKVEVENLGRRPSFLFTLLESLPAGMADLQPSPDPQRGVERLLPVEGIRPRSTQVLNLHLVPQHRGIYRWGGVSIRSGSPLGLTWSSRWIPAEGQWVVYPSILNLTHCPLMEAGEALQQKAVDRRQPLQKAANEGTTRSLRPYRRGDAMRYIHWRSSARFGELRTRELESVAGGQPLLLVLDHRPGWAAASFEQAVVVAASLYVWGMKRGMELRLWTESGETHGERAILTALAGIQPKAKRIDPPAQVPLLWLTCDPRQLQFNSEAQTWWIGWGAGFSGLPNGIPLDPGQDLLAQLQRIPTGSTLTLS